MDARARLVVELTGTVIRWYGPFPPCLRGSVSGASGTSVQRLLSLLHCTADGAGPSGLGLCRAQTHHVTVSCPHCTASERENLNDCLPRVTGSAAYAGAAIAAAASSSGRRGKERLLERVDERDDLLMVHR